MDNQEFRNGLTGTQKTGFVLLLIFGFMTIGLGMLQMRNTIYNPFAIRLTDADDLQSLFENQDMILQSIDTDHDGLNDWEELNFYETSPYLPDTDSDGIGDKVELDAGKNPLCPEGEDCGVYQGELPDADAETDVSPLSNSVATTNDILVGSGLASGDEMDTLTVLESIQDVSKLRELLLGTGSIGKKQLDEIDDATLMSLVNEMVGDQGDLLDMVATSTEE